jgi:Ca2+:H+ antiporter
MQTEKFSVSKLGPMFLLLLLSSLTSVGLEVFHGDPQLSFVVGFITIICLAKFLGDATEVVGHRVGSGIGAVLNATFGNATELILGIFAIQKGLFPLMKVSIVGGIFGNLMLVGGLSVLCGGLVGHFAKVKGSRRDLEVHLSAAQMGPMVLWTGAVILLIPTAVEWFEPQSGLGTLATIVAAISSLLAYGIFLAFSLLTHPEHFEETAAIDEVEEEEDPGYGWPTSVWIGILGLIAAGVGLESDFFVGVIEPAATAVGLREGFVAFVIVALAGGIAEHWSSVSAAINGKMAMAAGIVVGSSVQLVLFVLPVFALYSLALGQAASLAIDPVHAIPLLISYFLWAEVSRDGKFNWAEGAYLVIIALLTWGVMYFRG